MRLITFWLETGGINLFSTNDITKTKRQLSLNLCLLCFLLIDSRAWAAVGTTHSWSNEAYVWQRVWNRPVQEAVAAHATNFTELIVLAAEVTWREKQPQVIRVPIDYAKMTNTNIGLALRIGPFAGPFLPTDHTTTFLGELADSLVSEAKAGGLNPRELQIDFDCSESKLAGYQVWVEAVRHKIAPTPLTITVLPSWLGQASFGPLVGVTDGYVLQVHSLAKPQSATAPFTLCEPLAAKRAVERAGIFGVPFRVALPTYGYLMAFDSGGKFIGLSAEGPNKSWPVNAQLREVRADPGEMSQLARFWATNHPAALGGILWYRFPVAVDNLNWRWPTLSAIVAGHEPREQFHAAVRRVEAGLAEISLVNDGELDISSRLAVEVRWSDARLIAGDGARDFELAEPNASAARFQNESSHRLPAGETQAVGWLRLDHDREVQVEVRKF
jgi:hypothetical protein